jgi:glycosyltransferase involved in cell wall biosynthesis
MPRVHASGALTAPRLVTVGQLEQRYKGTDVLLGALRRLVESGLDARLVVVGEGRERPWLERRAGELGVAGRSTGSRACTPSTTSGSSSPRASRPFPTS